MAKAHALMERIDFLSDLTRLKYQGFLPLHNDHIIGLRYLKGVRPQVQVMSATGVVSSNLAYPGEAMNVMPALVPHTVRGLYGYWHINEEDELTIPIPLNNGESVVVLLEGMPKAGRWDRFVQFCRTCNRRIHEHGVKTGEVGIAGFWKAEEQAIAQFNGDLKLRTCPDCGTVNRHAYSYFSQFKGDREQRQAMLADQRETWGQAAVKNSTRQD
ncbi:MAG TPA: hypothetical protein VKV28_04555 [Candidatus Binataceae bacterium]|nr:hypothetical protein [Candidatus Binataceae bacterium]